MGGLSGHQSATMGSDTWLTPKSILDKLGGFDLDLCCPNPMPWRTAFFMVSLPVDGLRLKWWGRVWLNPPFGKGAEKWLEKLADHGNGIALVPARTETKMFFNQIWTRANSILFLRGRPNFCY